MRILILAALITTHLSAQPKNWAYSGMGVNRPLYAPSINPADPAEIYVSSEMGQWFRTLDAGKKWKRSDARNIHTTRESNVQFGINNSHYSILMENGLAVPKRSIDQAGSWNTITNPCTGNAYYLASDYYHPERVLVADANTLYYSNSSGDSFKAVYNEPILFIAGSVFFGDTIIVACKSGLIVSFDEGNTWNKLSIGGLRNRPIKSFAAAKQGHILRCAVITYPPTYLFPGFSTSDGYMGLADSLYVLNNLNGKWKALRNMGTPWVSPIFVGMAENDTGVIWVASGGNGGWIEPIVQKVIVQGMYSRIVHGFDLESTVRTGWGMESSMSSWKNGIAAYGFAVNKWNSSHAIITDAKFIHSTKDGGATWTANYVDEGFLNKIYETPNFDKKYGTNGLESSVVWQLHWKDKDRMVAAMSNLTLIETNDKGQSWGLFNYMYGVQCTEYWIMSITKFIWLTGQ